MTTPLDTEAVRARLDRATPWPWQWGTFYRDSFPDRPVAVASGDGRTDAVVFVEPSVDRQPESYDADFIANAPADIAALLAEVKRLRDSWEPLQTGFPMDSDVRDIAGRRLAAWAGDEANATSYLAQMIKGCARSVLAERDRLAQRVSELEGALRTIAGSTPGHTPAAQLRAWAMAALARSAGEGG